MYALVYHYIQMVRNLEIFICEFGNWRQVLRRFCLSFSKYPHPSEQPVYYKWCFTYIQPSSFCFLKEMGGLHISLRFS